MTDQQLENAKELVVFGIRAMLKAEDYESAAMVVLATKRADWQFGRWLERKMPAIITSNSPVFTGERAIGAMRWTGRTPDWHDQLRRDAASSRLPATVERIAADIDAHERGE